MKDKDCELESTTVYCKPCTGTEQDNDDYPTIKIRMGSIYDQHWFVIKPENYLLKMGDVCSVQIRKSPNRKKGKKQKWILGDVFLR